MGKVSDPPSPSGSSAAAQTHRLSPWHLLHAHQEPFLPAKPEVPAQSVQSSELPPDPISSTSSPRYTCRTEAVIFP